jgi:hypothetical protein
VGSAVGSSTGETGQRCAVWAADTRIVSECPAHTPAEQDAALLCLCLSCHHCLVKIGLHELSEQTDCKFVLQCPGRGTGRTDCAAAISAPRFLAVLLSCRYAYSADQLEYHYTKNQEVLKRAAAALQQQHQQQP